MRHRLILLHYKENFTIAITRKKNSDIFIKLAEKTSFIAAFITKDYIRRGLSSAVFHQESYEQDNSWTI